MNEHEAQRIAASVHELRPDWPCSSLLTLIRKNLIQRPRRDVMVAFAWVACEPATSTPARVLEAGPWWRAAGIEGTATSMPPKREEACFDCGRYVAACVCSADPDEPRGPTTRAPGKNPRNAEHAKAAREALARGNG